MPRTDSPGGGGGGPSSRSATKRLLREMESWRREQHLETGIERLGPVAEGDLLRWEAVVNGGGIGGGYDAGRWLLSITLPPTYPLHPPRMRFLTPVVHPNIGLRTGDICLDLLRDAWTPAYTLVECVRAVRLLLGLPAAESPLNVDVAALLRGGDVLGARRLVECWCAEEGGRYHGV